MARRLTKLLLLVVLMILTSASFLTILRAAWWIEDRAVTPNFADPVTEAQNAARRSTFRNNLKSIGLALHNYHDTHVLFPPGGTFTADGSPLHSWMTPIGPYLSFYIDDLHEDEPWNSQHNAKYFRSVIRSYLNDSLPGAPAVNKDGFALSHIAANQHVMGPNHGMSLEEITDGTSNTLLVGEVNSRFQPWGAPTNWRDPMKGLNKSVYGFGSHPDRKGVTFLLADGSVRFIREGIDQNVLDAISTPAGGEANPDWEE